MISIVIPVRNDAEAWRRSLDHLDELQGREDLEVIVAATEAGAGTVSAILGAPGCLCLEGPRAPRS